METYWVPGVNNHGGFDRRAIAEMTDVWEMEEGLDAKVREAFDAAPAGAIGEDG